MESIKEQFFIEDYSVSQTTLEQVFLNFARAQHPPREERLPCCMRFNNCCRFVCGCCGTYCKPVGPKETGLVLAVPTTAAPPTHVVPVQPPSYEESVVSNSAATGQVHNQTTKSHSQGQRAGIVTPPV